MVAERGGMMDRLTHKARYEAGYKQNKNVNMWECIDKLGQYEDIGLTPAQIREIDKLYKEKCEEVARYQKAEEDEKKLEGEHE